MTPEQQFFMWVGVVVSAIVVGVSIWGALFRVLDWWKERRR